MNVANALRDALYAVFTWSHARKERRALPVARVITPRAKLATATPEQVRCSDVQIAPPARVRSRTRALLDEFTRDARDARQTPCKQCGKVHRMPRIFNTGSR